MMVWLQLRGFGINIFMTLHKSHNVWLSFHSQPPVPHSRNERLSSSFLSVIKQRFITDILSLKIHFEERSGHQYQPTMTSRISNSGPQDLNGAATPAMKRTSNEDHTGGTPTKIKEEENKPSKSKTILVMASVFLSMFLVGLDRTIISTVSPIESNMD